MLRAGVAEQQDRAVVGDDDRDAGHCQELRDDSRDVAPRTLPPVPAVAATVVTTPAGVTLRLVELSAPVTRTLPALSTATPVGRLKRASGPVPSALPETNAVPATVVTTPAGVTLRIEWLPSSAMNT